jgi:DNA invertase Pin-like site-specific DNA recombinase
LTKQVLHIYTRVSSSFQADKGTSLDFQLELGKTRAKELGFDYEHWDEGGKSSHHENIQDRPSLFALYEAIKLGKVKHLWIYDQSRLSRNDQVASIFRYECNKQGVILYTKDGQLDLSNSSDKLLKNMLDAIAEFDNSIRAERSRLGKINKVKSGYWHGGPPPFGYKIENKKLVLHEVESKSVKQIFDDVISGKSTVSIKNFLDSQGILPRRKKGMWTIGSIQALIKNTHYMGFYTYKDKKSEDYLDVVCPAIVDEFVWKKAQELRTRQTARTQQKNGTKHFYLLRDLMFCGHCGRPISGRIKPSKNEYFYYCPNKERTWVANGKSDSPWQRKTGCGMERSINIKDCDELVWQTVTSVHKKSSLLKEEVKKRVFKEKGISVVKTEQQIKTLNSRIKKLEKQSDQIKDTLGKLEYNFMMGKIEKKSYSTAVSLANEELDEVKNALLNAKNELKGDKEAKVWVDWVKIYGDEVDANDALSDQEKKDYIKGLVDKIVVRFLPGTNEHQIDITFLMPIVGDDFIWNDPKKKSLGIKLIEGQRETTVNIKKKDMRWTKMTPVQNDSVTVE